LEWVRDVNQLTGNVAVWADKKAAGRFVVWSHSEFVAFEPPSEPVHDSKQTNFYNPNLVELSEVIEGWSDYVADHVEVKQ
jgi:hypothetical protein